jgi:hypothetical protein
MSSAKAVWRESSLVVASIGVGVAWQTQSFVANDTTISSPAGLANLGWTEYFRLTSLVTKTYCPVVMPQSRARSGGFTPPFCGWRGKPAATFETETEALRPVPLNP